MVPATTKTILSTAMPPLGTGTNSGVALFESTARHLEVSKAAIPNNFTSITTSAPGAVLLVGGTTAAFCSSALQSTYLTPLSLIYMLLLALQYSIQPRISKACLHPQVNKRSVALVEEVVKVTIASSVLAFGTAETRTRALKDWSPSFALMVAGLPAALYSVQGILFLYSYQNLDSVTFNGLTQTKMLWTALCCYLLLGQVQSKFQIAALFLLATSTLLFQGTLEKLFVSKKHRQQKQQSAAVSSSKARFQLGIVPCLAASFLSGMAGALSQKALQQWSPGGRNAYLYTIEVSAFTGTCLTFSIVMDHFFKKKHATLYNNSENVVSSMSFFQHWTLQTWIPILVKSCGGVLTALVHKHAGSVAKGYALICGLVLSGVIQTVYDGKTLSVSQILGMLLVNVSSWMHFKHPK